MEVKDPYSENYKTLMMEIEDDKKKWKDTCVPGLEKLVSLKCHLSPMWYNVDCSQLVSRFDHSQLQLVYLIVERIVQREISSSTKLRKPLLTRSISHSTFSILCTNLFLCFSCVFTFLEIIKHNMPKMLLFFFHLQLLKWLHKNSPILISFF